VSRKKPLMIQRLFDWRITHAAYGAGIVTLAPELAGVVLRLLMSSRFMIEASSRTQI